MNILRFFTETPDERRARKRKAALDAYHKQYDHPDEWGPGYGITMEWTDKRRGKRK